MGSKAYCIKFLYYYEELCFESRLLLGKDIKYQMQGIQLTWTDTGELNSGGKQSNIENTQLEGKKEQTKANYKNKRHTYNRYSKGVFKPPNANSYTKCK